MDSFIQSLATQIQGTHATLIILLLAFFGGLVSSLSPCSLGLLPIVIAYIGGYSKESHVKLFVQLISFSIGMSIILSIIGVLCALTGKAFAGFSSPIWILLLASFILIFGLDLLGILELNFPTLIKKFPQAKSHSIFVYPMLVGMVFALAATPCSSPILASIMALASLSANIAISIAMFFLFALGQCIIIILAGLFTSVVKNLKSVAGFTEILMKISGFVFVLIAFYIYYHVFKEFFI